ncbi:uncharacterized protein LOC117322389 isoform X2 [Pecten maximus]|uniref:uncharacterized protein LOC117322389 isoform X2 n=1 Tax=Pecten maximus TaxID=6579 RepID=UPI0014587994|nr:uncharacterized protein LOC117322389 isoform X2 [Pecten maximus]
MGMRWQLYDPDFYTDIIFGFEVEDESDEEVYLCRCSGRGKSDEERRIPRMPLIKASFQELQNLPTYGPVVKKGKGRGRMLREKVETMPAVHVSTFEPGCKDNIDRPRREPMFLDNSSFVENTDFAVKKFSPFASLSKQTSQPPPSPQTFEEDFPSLSSSPQSVRNQRPVYMVPRVSDNDSESASLKDLNSLAQIFKESASISFSSLSSCPSDSSPEKSVVFTSTSCRTTASSDEQVYASDSESSRSSEALEWNITQGHVVQLDGLPKGCDLSTLEELVAQYGTIKETQVLQYEASVAVRFRLTSEDACEWVVSCLDGTDCLFPESNRTLHCYKVE